MRSITVCIRPMAVWKLLRVCIDRTFRVHPLVRYFEAIGVQHMCVQIPTFDQDIEDSVVPNRSMPRYNGHIAVSRRRLRQALIGRNEPNSYALFIGLYPPSCSSITFHNLPLVSLDLACASMAPVTDTSTRIFFRPCTGADGDVTNKVFDNYCYNHRDENDRGITDGKCELSSKMKQSRQEFEFIDIDWLRGKYDPLRDGSLSKSIDQDVQRQVQEESGDVASGNVAGVTKIGEKRVRMSREVEPCRCCGKHQLSVVEVSRTLLRVRERNKVT